MEMTATRVFREKIYSLENFIAGLVFLNETLITELTKPEHLQKACISLHLKNLRPVSHVQAMN